MKFYLNPCFSRFSFDKNDTTTTTTTSAAPTPPTSSSTPSTSSSSSTSTTTKRKLKMTKKEQAFNQSCDSSNGSASLEDRKVNSLNTDHETYAMDDAIIDESLNLQYHGVSRKEEMRRRRKYILAGAVIILALLLVAGVIAFICVYVKRENEMRSQLCEDIDGNKMNKLKRDCYTKNSTDGPTSDSTTDGKGTARNKTNICNTKKCREIADYLLKTMNMSADPCQNFHEFSCGKWAKEHPLPASMPYLDTMGLLSLRKMNYLEKVIEEEIQITASAKTKLNPNGFKSKILTYYKSCMDFEQIDKKGKSPLLDFIAQLGRWSPINSWQDQNNNLDITELLIITHRYFTPSIVDDTIRSPLFKSIVKVNDQNSTQHTFELNLPNFPLLNTNDFLSNSTRAKMIREKYSLLKTNYVALLGPSHDAEERIKRITKFELDLANISYEHTMHRNVYQQFNSTTIEKVQNYVGKQIDWFRMIQGLFDPVGIKIPKGMKIGIRSIDFFRSLDKLIAKTNIQTVKDYIIWVVVWTFGKYASSEFREADYNFQRALVGIQERPKRARTCIKDIEQTMEFGLTSLYVKNAITDGDKILATEIIQNVTREFKNNLVNVEWMDVSTKAAAFRKVDSIKGNIGYPDFVRDEYALDKMYSPVKISRKEYFTNILSMYKQKRLSNIKLLDKKVDRTVYDLPPTLVEAYFDPNKNRIVFLAGLLHTPFYDNKRPMALNYGALGLVAGHEVTHAFDDLGGQYDGNGERRNWWSNSSLNQFNIRSKCIEEQYGNYELLGEKLNGKNTLGENIADNGGIKVAYMGYKEWERVHGQEKLLPDINLNMDQLFFVSHGQVWCGAYRDEYIRQSLQTNLHSPSKFRIIGPLSNLKEFSDVFKCKLGDPMNPKKKCRVW